MRRPIPPINAENELWYVVPARSVRRRVLPGPPRDGGHPTRSSRPSEAAGSDRTEAKARRQSAQGGREGHGEGRLGTELPGGLGDDVVQG